jgi:hypothetical protein
MALGVLGTLGFALPALGIGALMGRRAPAQALYAIYYLVLSNLALALSRPLESSTLRLFSANNDVKIIARAMFDATPRAGDPPAWQAAAAIGVLALFGFAVVYARVRDTESAGLGSG